MQDPATGNLDRFDSVKEAQKARGKQKRPIYFKGQPVLLVTPEGVGGTFVISKLGRRVIRIKGISENQFKKMTGAK